MESMQAAFPCFAWARVKIDLFRSLRPSVQFNFDIINPNATVAVADKTVIKGP